MQIDELYFNNTVPVAYTQFYQSVVAHQDDDPFMAAWSLVQLSRHSKDTSILRRILGQTIYEGSPYIVLHWLFKWMHEFTEHQIAAPELYDVICSQIRFCSYGSDMPPVVAYEGFKSMLLNLTWTDKGVVVHNNLKNAIMFAARPLCISATIGLIYAACENGLIDYKIALELSKTIWNHLPRAPRNAVLIFAYKYGGIELFKEYIWCWKCEGRHDLAKHILDDIVKIVAVCRLDEEIHKIHGRSLSSLESHMLCNDENYSLVELLEYHIEQSKGYNHKIREINYASDINSLYDEDLKSIINSLHYSIVDTEVMTPQLKRLKILIEIIRK